jgi:hypothetical protein
MMSNGYLLASLGYIQESIKRMSNCSMLIKGWSMTLTGVVLAIAKKDYTLDDIISLTLVLSIFNFMFYIMDSYYLFLERKFRNEYNIKLSNLSDLEKGHLEIFNCTTFKVSKLRALFSISTFPFHSIVILTSLTAAYWK